MKAFKIRCSAIGHIMTEPRTKKAKESNELSETTKGYCKDWLKSQLYNRKLEFTSKYTDKGIIMEDSAIDFISEQLGIGLLFKNEKRVEDDFMTGETDIDIPDFVIDIKNSWSWETFPILDDEIPNKLYYWQLQGYMNLTNKKKAKLIYVLSNTPLHLIERDANNYSYYNGYSKSWSEPDMNIYNEFFEKLTYDDIPDNLKIKMFDIDRNDEDIKLIKSRVIQCRDYIEILKSNLC